MSLVRRTREPVAPVARVVTRPAVASARRSTLARPAAAATRNFYSETVEQLQLIAILDTEQQDLDRRRLAVETEIDSLMLAGSLEHVDDGVFKVDRKAGEGRSTTVIDPLKFKKHCGDKAFWECVKIGVTEAKQYVSDKEMGKVGTVTAGKAGPIKLTVARIKKGK